MKEVADEARTKEDLLKQLVKFNYYILLKNMQIYLNPLCKYFEDNTGKALWRKDNK